MYNDYMNNKPTEGKGSRFINVPAEAITDLLDSKGFKKDISGKEIVYTMEHKKNPACMIKIYTSLPTDRKSVRGCGQDAIRCVGVINGTHKVYGVYKGPRVYRTGTVDGVLDRMLTNARIAYKFLGDKYAK
jgi:hypothetical protein